MYSFSCSTTLSQRLRIKQNEQNNRLSSSLPNGIHFRSYVCIWMVSMSDHNRLFGSWLQDLANPTMRQYEQVREFREKLNLPISDVPALLAPEHLSFYARFLMEELSELMKAHEKGDLVDAADAVVDLLYVTLGLSHHLGLPLPELFQVVHKANMAKEPGTTKRGVSQDATKPEGWVPPEQEIMAILYRNRK